MALSCQNPIAFNKSKHICKSGDTMAFNVPCGRCLPCKINRRSEWTTRLIAEKEYYNESCFITLTYAPEFIPRFNSLCKEDLQKFWKRFRKRIGGKKIKYFACGEYGERNFRPHYHAIVFNANIDRHLLADVWGLGRVHVGYVSDYSIRYCAGYIEKKVFGACAQAEWYGLRDPEYSACSKNLGLDYLEDNEFQIIENGLSMNGKPIRMPRYYKKKIAEKYPNVKEQWIDHAKEVFDEKFGHLSESEKHFTIKREGNRCYYDLINRQKLFNKEKKL